MIIRIFILWITFVSYTYADQYQLKERRANESYDLSFAAVTVNQNNAVVFNGRTDKLGRIAISLPNGTYTADIQDFHGVRRSVNITVDGTPTIKVVDVPVP
jgi:hypothetical protein